jgi:flagellar assembly protein FliH
MKADNKTKPPDYTFDINPGLEVKKAFITKEAISADESVFTAGQLAIIERFLNAEEEKFQIERARFQEEKARLEEEHLQQLETEIHIAWQKGNEDGVEATKHEMIGQVETAIEQVQAFMDSVIIKTDKFMEIHEQEILRLIINIARKVIEYEVTLNPKIILRLVKNSIELLNEKEEIRILVNPEEWTTVRDNLDKLAVSIDLPKNIEVVPYENIERGGCRIDFKAGSIDADLDTQFTEIKRKLLKM